MSELALIGIAAGVLAASGLPALLLPRRSLAGQRLTAALMVVGSVTGLCGVARALAAPAPATFACAWTLPAGRFAVAVDPLSAFFLALVFIVPALGAIYGLGYWRQTAHPENGRKLGAAAGLLAGAMALVTIAADGLLFLLAWELMALAAFFAATTEDDDPAVRRAGWIYLVATHVGTLFLLAFFALWRAATGSFALTAAAAGGVSSVAGNALFVLALLGFGCKAGILPLHVWLPGAHANAPSHVSAVLSGVMLKMGIYGLVRFSGLLPAAPHWWGGLLLALGAVTGVLGIAFALGQQDLKRLLAYSSIENIGIVVMGLGLALLGRAQGRADWIVLGMTGALLHVWNHGLFKPLLFLNAGAIIHAAHTRQIDRLGGLAARMPRTAALFLCGAVSICGLPPFNGFVGEWLIYLGLFRTLGAASGAAAGPAVAALGVVALSLIGALAIACFVKLVGVVFLGTPRSDAAAQAHDPAATLTGPMLLLAGACLTLGLLPALALPALARGAAVWAGGSLPPLHAFVECRWIGALGATLLGVALLAALALRRLLRRRPPAVAGTWDCGYAQPTARMQYTGSSFAQSLVGLFSWALWPKRQAPRLERLFPRPAEFSQSVPDTLLDRLVLPFAAFVEERLLWWRRFQQGRLHLYVVYVLATLLLLLLFGRIGLQP